MRALITGADGQDGWYLAARLLDNGWRVIATARAAENFPADFPLVEAFRAMDVTDGPLVRRVMMEEEPDVVFHLAAASSVKLAWRDPAALIGLNVVGTTNVLQAAQALAERGSLSRVVCAGSAEMFDPEGSLPTREDSRIGPTNPYGTSKAAVFHLVRNFRRVGLPASTAILFSHESERRPRHFVSARIAHGVARIARGGEEPLTIGTLDTRRDWMHATDAVAALEAIALYEAPEDFVVATGVSRSVGEFVKVAFECAGIHDWERWVVVDPTLARVGDAPEQRGDARYLTNATGWRPQRPFEDWVMGLVAQAIAAAESPAEV